jgi:hypothetical protein
MINSFDFREDAQDGRVTLDLWGGHRVLCDVDEAGWRIKADKEVQGLDLSQCGEEDYDWGAST